jgi:hypothetical protein
VAEEIYRSPKWLDFIVQDVKTPFTGAFEKGELPNLQQTMVLLSRLPNLTRENVHLPNTFILIELRDEFFSIPGHEALYGWTRPIWNGFIFLYDYDSYYRWRLDFVLERWRTKAWTPALGTLPPRQMLRLAAFMLTLNKRPELTKGDSQLANVHTLIELEDEFFQYENNPGRTPAFKFIWKSGIGLYNESEYCRYPIDWVLERLKAKPWLPRDKHKPLHFWKEWDKKPSPPETKVNQN